MSVLIKTKKKLIAMTKVFFAIIFVLSVSVGIFMREVLASEDSVSQSVADPDLVVDPTKYESKSNAAQAMEARNDKDRHLQPFANEINFLYSRKEGIDIVRLYNNESLKQHSYIMQLGYLMEYLGENAKNKGYYDVRFQGGIYAIKKADVDRFIPLSQIRSFPHYANEGGYVVHRVEGDPYKENSWYLTTTLGKAPAWMEKDKKYYSFSGIYFTDSPDKLGYYTQQTRAVNPDKPYYDYYLYQPARTQTNFTAAELDRLFNILVPNEKTKMTNTGADFIATQNKYGINALLLFTMAIHESNYGRSNFAVDRNNLFGVDAVDSNPGAAAYFPSIAEGIKEQGNYLSWVYADADYQYGANYYGSHLGTKSSGMNVKYASDPYWGEKIANHYARIDRMLKSKDYQKYGLAIARQGAQVYWNADGTDPAHTYKNSTSLLTYMYPVIYYTDDVWTEIALEPPYNRDYAIGPRHPEGGAYYWYRGYVNASDMIKISKGTQGEVRVVTDGDMRYYLDGKRNIKKAEQINDDKKILRIFEYYPHTIYNDNHQSHIKNIFDIDEKGNLKRGRSYKDNTNGTSLLKAYEYYPNTKFGNKHYSHVFTIFDLEENGEIKKAYSYKNNSSAQKMTKIYEYYPGAIYGEDHYRHVKQIFEVEENGAIKKSYEYADDTRATGLIRVYEYYQQAKHNNNYDNHIKNIFEINETGSIVQGRTYKNNTMAKALIKAYEYYPDARYGENHYAHVRNAYDLADNGAVKKSYTYKDNTSGKVILQVYEYYANAIYDVDHEDHIKHIFENDNKGNLKRGLAYQDNSRATKLTRAYEYHAGTKYGQNHYSHVANIFELAEDGAIRKASSFKDNSSAKKLTKIYEYHDGAIYGQDHFAHVKHLFEVEENGVIKRAYYYEDNSRAQKILEAYEYYPNTRHGADHENHVEYTYYLKEDKVIEYAVVRRDNEQEPYQIVFFRPNTKFGDKHRTKIISRKPITEENGNSEKPLPGIR